MNNNPEISPEEKLLKLIKNPKSTAPKMAPEAGDLAGKEDGRPVSPSSGKPPSFKVSGRVSREKFFWLNFALVIVALGFGIYLLFDFLVLDKSYQEKLDKVKTAVSRDDYKAVMEAIRAPVPYGSYSAKFSGKDLFKSQYVSEVKKSGIPKKEIREMIKNLSLMGIISEENPQAIVEDKVSRKSYTLSKGEYISGMEIVEIKDNKIVLEYEKQRFDLYL